MPPRHGTYSRSCMKDANGLVCRCDPCREIRNKYARFYRWAKSQGHEFTIDADASQRKLQALHRSGWTWTALGEKLGYAGPAGPMRILARPRMRAATAARVDKVYWMLQSVPGPMDREGIRARERAKARGWPAPMDWEDIEAGILAPPPPKVAPDRFDTSEVDYVLDTHDWAYVGKGLSRLEKIELFRRWIAWGRSENELCRLTKLRAGRYGRGFQHELPTNSIAA